MQAYLVLARKYRPKNFQDLKGQDHLVRTFQNSVKNDRIAHAYLLTGIRGVGKTTSARIIAKSLNCLGSDNIQTSAQIEPCNQCSNCKLIVEDRHPDVFEMDAASNTSVDDVRKVIEEIQYRPLTARYKVIIIDEVHMLSTSAFNALLKTLEEPPSHVIFIFATTELRKIPLTTISRCQRFDLKRLTENEISKHLIHIATLENIIINSDASMTLAKLADGSVRDALSLFDQAINIAGGSDITTALVQDMVGTVNVELIIDLYEKLLSADIIAAIDLMRQYYHNGNDPWQIINDVLSMTHELSIMQLKQTEAQAILPTDNAGNVRLEKIASQLSISVTTRIWQIITKSMNEIKFSAHPVAAAEMLLIKITYAAAIPSIDDLISKYDDGSIENTKINTTNHKSSENIPEDSLLAAEESLGDTQPKILKIISEKDQKDLVTQHTESANIERQDIVLNNFQDIINLCEKNDQPILRYHLYNDVYCVNFAPNNLELTFKERAPKEIEKMLKALLFKHTKQEWYIKKSVTQGDSLGETAKQNFKQRQQDASNNPLVSSVMQHFPGSEITNC